MLGTLYRTRMYKKQTISLGEEFELLEMYLKIMAMRYGDKFVYQTQLEEAVGDRETDRVLAAAAGGELFRPWI